MGIFGDIKNFVDRNTESIQEQIGQTGQDLSNFGGDIAGLIGGPVGAGGAIGEPTGSARPDIKEEAQSLLNEIESDDKISERTREDFTSQLREEILESGVLEDSEDFKRARGTIESISNALEAAREGEREIFESRQAVEERFNTLEERPNLNRGQTFINEGLNSLTRQRDQNIASGGNNFPNPVSRSQI